MDSFSILGIAPDAGPAEIKRAYRRLAMAWHPDRNSHPEATERFKQIRAAYDALLALADAPGAEESDVPEEAPEPAPRAADIHLDLEISLEEAAFGCEKDIQVRRGAACPTCDGSGESGISRSSLCQACHGSGRLRDRHHGLARCPDCDGRGFISRRTCPDCGGSGRELEDVSLKVTVPAGILPGDELRLAGQGEPGSPGIQPGNLLLRVAIAPHGLFQWEGADLSYVMPVSVLKLLAGASIRVPVLGGADVVDLEAGSAEPRTLRLAGKGYPGRRSRQPGDLLVRLEPVVPQKLDDRQRRLLLEADAAGEQALDESLPDIAAWRRRYGV